MSPPVPNCPPRMSPVADHFLLCPTDADDRHTPSPYVPVPLPPACLSKLHVCDSPICLISRIHLLYSLPLQNTVCTQLLSPQPGMTSGAQFATGRSASHQPLQPLQSLIQRVFNRKAATEQQRWHHSAHSTCREWASWARAQTAQLTSQGNSSTAHGPMCTSQPHAAPQYCN